LLAIEEFLSWGAREMLGWTVVPLVSPDLGLIFSALGVGMRDRGERQWGTITNAQYKSNWDCHYENPPVT
jgi:hypothetical protein